MNLLHLRFYLRLLFTGKGIQVLDDFPVGGNR
jgi:hypothetical protein